MAETIITGNRHFGGGRSFFNMVRISFYLTNIKVIFLAFCNECYRLQNLEIIIFSI